MNIIANHAEIKRKLRTKTNDDQTACYHVLVQCDAEKRHYSRGSGVGKMAAITWLARSPEWPWWSYCGCGPIPTIPTPTSLLDMQDTGSSTHIGESLGTEEGARLQGASQHRAAVLNCARINVCTHKTIAFVRSETRCLVLFCLRKSHQPAEKIYWTNVQCWH